MRNARSEAGRRAAEERLQEESRTLETLNRTGAALAGELDLERLVQMVTDAGVELTGARFGAFFYNVLSEAGESYMLYTLSGVARSAFERFPMPRSTAVFGPTFKGEGVIRSDDILADGRYGRNAPHRGMPKGHLPVRSYLAVPVVSRSGEVLGGLFFGHPEPARFGERHERLMLGVAAQAAVAIDNARLYRAAQAELEERRRAEARLRESEAKFQAIADSIDQMIWSTRPDGHHDYYNQRWYDYTGVPKGSTDGEAWSGTFHPDDQERAWATWRHSLATGEPYHIEYRLRHRSGRYRWVIGRAQCVRDHQGRITRWYGTCTDIHDFKVAEDRQTFLLALGDRLRNVADPVEATLAAAEALGRRLDAARAGYGEIDEAGEVVRVARDWTRDGAVVSLAGEARILDGFGPAMIAELRAGRTLVVDDCTTDPRAGAAYAAAWVGIGCRALVVVPLVKEGWLRAILFLHQPAPRWWGEEEVTIAEHVAQRTWDAVQRARAEDELRRLNEGLEAQVAERTAERDRVWANSRDLLVVVDADGAFRAVSPAWTAVLGHRADEVVGRRVLDYVHPDDAELTREGLGTAVMQGGLTDFENRCLHRDGGPRWISWRTSAESDLVYAYGRDVTAEKQAAGALQAAESRIRSIFETTYQFQGFMSADGTLLDANRASLAGIGARLGDVVGLPFWDTPWCTGTPGMPERVRAAIPLVAAGQPSRQEITVNLPTGQRTFDFSMRPVLDEAGRVIGIVPEAIEVTERRRAEEQLRQAQKMEAVGQLTGGVAHDFNNLLTIIRSSADLLRRPDLPEERRRRYVDAIVETVDRAAKITGQLLAFARRQALKPEVFDVAERVRAVADLLRTVVGARIRIEARAPRERCFVEADASQFETALVNMAVNARDAMDGDGALTVWVQCVSQVPPIRGHKGASGSFVAVSVADTGSGIPRDKLPHIFEPFFTTKEVGKGTGLGLSQVYGFAKQSGGDVAVESQIGRGTTFTLYVPRVEGKQAGEPAEDRAAPRPRPEGGGRRVLVVEDNAEVGAFSTQILQDLGYETTWATSGAEALNLLADGQARFDVVFSDVVMPGMDGVQLGQEIRRRHPGLPVVLTSGYSHVLAEEGRHGFELLHKPYAAEELSRVLRRVARGRSGR